MQLVEYFIWKDQSCGLMNHLDWDIIKLFGGKMLIYIFFFLYYAMFFLLLLSKPLYHGFIIAIMLLGSILFSVFFC